MENASQLQCKALSRRQKSRRSRNNGQQWKKQCAEQWEQSEIRARDQLSVVGPEDGNGAARESLSGGPSLLAESADEPGRNSHTLIYAISTNSERAQERNSRPAVSRFEFLVMRLCPAAGDIRLAQARRMEALRLRGCTGND
jgi:hypothetical protein